MIDLFPTAGSHPVRLADHWTVMIGHRTSYLGLHAREGCCVLTSYGDEGGWCIVKFSRDWIRRVDAANDGAS